LVVAAVKVVFVVAVTVTVSCRPGEPMPEVGSAICAGLSMTSSLPTAMLAIEAGVNVEVPGVVVVVEVVFTEKLE
jgi:hypothetical protein